MSVYAVADLHGCRKQWDEIHNFLKADDKLFILGDCIDRGIGGLAILKEALDDPRITVLCGNHEDMMVEALEEEEAFGNHDYWGWRWFQNGGNITYDEWQEAGRDFRWIGRIRALPLWAEYTNQDGDKIIMSHSGVTPKLGFNIESCSRKSLLWDRDHLNAKHWHRNDNEFHVHGHTPILLMPFFKNKDVEIEPGALWYCDGHKINIDNGGVWTDNICLLDLDTWDEHIF
jgi:hypothetical protein